MILQIHDHQSARYRHAIKSLLESYDVWNAKLGYRKLIASYVLLEVSAGLNNILDERYASMLLINAGSFGGRAPRYYYPGLPRNWYVNATLRAYLKAQPGI